MSDNFMGGGLPAPEQPEETPATGRDPKVLIGGGIGLALVAVGRRLPAPRWRRRQRQPLGADGGSGPP